MKGFRVLMDGTELPLAKGIALSTKRQALIGADSYWLQSPSLSLAIDFFQGHDFLIVLQSSTGRPPKTLQFQFEDGFFAMPIAWNSDNMLQLPGGECCSFKALQYNLFNTAAFSMEAGAESVTLLFTRLWLEPYAVYCPRLARLLEPNPNGQPISLLETPQFLSTDEVSIINRILAYEQAPALAGNYYSSLLQVFMISLVKQVNSLIDAGACEPLDLEKAAKVRDIILADFEIYHTVEALARMVRIAEMKLQLAFKQLYGTTVMHFSRDARLEKGYQLLTTTDYPLRVVCMMVGYDDPSNFSGAFKKKYGYWPGYIRKSSKQNN